MNLTAEQSSIIEAALTHKDLVVTAGAGSGKTFTCTRVAEALAPLQGIYLCFNKRNADEAQAKMPPNVVAKTFHSLAFAGFGAPMKHRLSAGRVSSTATARMLRIDPIKVTLKGGVDKTFAAGFLAALVMKGVDRFCQSDALEPAPWHIPAVPIPDPGDRDAVRSLLRGALFPVLQRAWVDIQDQRGQLSYSHDCYLKALQLALASGGKVRGLQSWDFVMVDESQDSSMCRLSVARHVGRQLVLVGDENQMIYEWNGAQNVMAHDSMRHAQRRTLSQSFRFGVASAAVANLALAKLPTELRVTGFDQIPTRIAVSATPDAVLCRTNGGVLGEVIRYLDNDRKPFVVGGVNDIVRFVEAAEELQDRRSTEHPDLRMFDSWSEAVATIEEDDMLADLRMLVKLIKDRGTGPLLSALRQCSASEARADVTLSTIHKAKGLEWDEVRISSDVTMPKDDDLAGWRLIYVAVTRARLVLDLSTCPVFKVAGGAVSLAPDPKAEPVPVLCSPVDPTSEQVHEVAGPWRPLGAINTRAGDIKVVDDPVFGADVCDLCRAPLANGVCVAELAAEELDDEMAERVPVKARVSWSPGRASAEVWLDDRNVLAFPGASAAEVLNAVDAAFRGWRFAWSPGGDGEMVATITERAKVTA